MAAARTRSVGAASLLGLLHVAGFVACAATLAGLAGRHWWVLDLPTHFRTQYAGALLVLALVCGLVRLRVAAAIYLVCAAINVVFVAPYYFAERSDAPSDADVRRALVANVFTANRQHERVLELIRTTQPDLLVLEEVNARWLAALEPLRDRYPYTLSEPREDNFGIALWSRTPYHDARVVRLGDLPLPSILARFDSPAGPFAVLATHAPPPAGRELAGLRNVQLGAIAELARRLDEPLLVLGDLNASPWSHHFRRLLQQAGLRDSATGRGIQATWPAGSLLLRIPIDHALHTPGIGISQRWIGPDIGSDHLPLLVEFAPVAGPG